jgi:hypothetical protein
MLANHTLIRCSDCCLLSHTSCVWCFVANVKASDGIPPLMTHHFLIIVFVGPLGKMRSTVRPARIN